MYRYQHQNKIYPENVVNHSDAHNHNYAHIPYNMVYRIFRRFPLCGLSSRCQHQLFQLDIYTVSHLEPKGKLVNEFLHYKQSQQYWLMVFHFGVRLSALSYLE